MGALSRALALLVLPAQVALGQSADLAWPEATQQSEPWTRWWWMGSAVDRENLTAELETLAAAGFGGVEVTSIYGVRGYEHAFVPYLSDRWLDLLLHAAAEARRLGMGLDMPPGSGWRLGGPSVPREDASASLHIEADTVRGVYVADARPLGDKVKRPAPGGEGYAIDPFSRLAVRHYLDAYGGRLKAIPSGTIRAFFHDSFEYTGTGSAELFEMFRRRRGYDLRRYLRFLLGEGDPDVVARVKSDYRETMDEMLLDHLLRPLTAWAHERGSRSRNQAHGSPGNLLDLYAASDIPETELFGPLGGTDSDPLISKFASSAAHVAGRGLTSAETGTWLGEHFTVTLDQLKQAVDQLFVSGVNHVIYHGTAYSPREAAWPGWLFYASTDLNPRDALWRDLPALNRYIARVQSILQSGQPDNDVLLYWPVYDNWHDTTGLRLSFAVHQPSWFHQKPVGAVARELWQAGYGFDYVSDRLLRDNVSASERRTILVPRTDHMPVETFVRLLDLARAGATVIFVERLPADVPGLAQLQERRRRLEDAKRRLTLGQADWNGVRWAVVEKGRVLVGDRVESLLCAAGVRRERIVDHPGVRVIRRTREGGHHYFISHTGSTTLEGWVPLAVSASAVAIMDPASGRTGIARLRTRKDGAAEVYLRLEPGASIILRSFDRPAAGAPWRYRRPVGAAVELRGTWSVSFLAGGPVLPASFRTDTLVSWTEREDSEAGRFAGTARYTIRFDAPGEASAYLLDLGRVAESARVRLNGEDLGILFARPFNVDLGRVRRSGNELQIEVTNLSANRIRDLDLRGVPWKVFEDINFVGLDYKPFDASGWPLQASGLLGPVRLQPLADGGGSTGPRGHAPGGTRFDGSRAPPAARQHGLPGHRDRRHGHGPELHVRRHEVLLGVQQLVPGDLFPGVGRLPPHDRAERGFGHLPALVQRLPGADARDQVGVLLHVRVRPGGLRVPAPRRGALDDRVAVRPAARADDPLGDVRRRAVDLAAHRKHVHAVRVLEVDREVIVDVPVRGIGAPLTPAHADGLHWMRAERPVRHVDVVDVLLHDVVSRQPREVEPVPDLPLDVGPLRLPRLHPQTALVPINLGRDDVADGAVVDALHRRPVTCVVAPLRSGHDGEALLGGEIGRGDHGAHLHRIHRHRLLHEDVLARLDRRGEVSGAERRRRRE